MYILAALHFHEDKEFLCCVSKLLTLSLFDSLVSLSDDGTVQLPEAFIERYIPVMAIYIYSIYYNSLYM